MTDRPEHQVFVTLAGSTGRAVGVTADGRYDGVDFPGATTFVPGGHRRRSSYEDGTIDYVSLLLDRRRVAEAAGSDTKELEFRGLPTGPTRWCTRWGWPCVTRSATAAWPGA